MNETKNLWNISLEILSSRFLTSANTFYGFLLRFSIWNGSAAALDRHDGKNDRQLQWFVILNLEG